MGPTAGARWHLSCPQAGACGSMRENALLSRASLDLGLFQHASERGEKKKSIEVD
jgi:hypothetical protein